MCAEIKAPKTKQIKHEVKHLRAYKSVIELSLRFHFIYVNCCCGCWCCCLFFHAFFSFRLLAKTRVAQPHRAKCEKNSCLLYFSDIFLMASSWHPNIKERLLPESSCTSHFLGNRMDRTTETNKYNTITNSSAIFFDGFFQFFFFFARLRVKKQALLPCRCCCCWCFYFAFLLSIPENPEAIYVFAQAQTNKREPWNVDTSIKMEYSASSKYNFIYNVMWPAVFAVFDEFCWMLFLFLFFFFSYFFLQAFL